MARKKSRANPSLQAPDSVALSAPASWTDFISKEAYRFVLVVARVESHSADARAFRELIALTPGPMSDPFRFVAGLSDLDRKGRSKAQSDELKALAMAVRHANAAVTGTDHNQRLDDLACCAFYAGLSLSSHYIDLKKLRSHDAQQRRQKQLIKAGVVDKHAKLIKEFEAWFPLRGKGRNEKSIAEFAKKRADSFKLEPTQIERIIRRHRKAAKS